MKKALAVIGIGLVAMFSFGFTSLTNPSRQPLISGDVSVGSGLCRVNATGGDGVTGNVDITCSTLATGAATGLDMTTQAPTSSPGTGIVVNHTGYLRPFVNEVTVTRTALAAAATTDITIATTPAVTRIIRVLADVTQVFTGGGLTSMTIQCGNTAGGTQYLLANSVFTAQNTWGDAAAEIGAGLLSATVADFGTSSAGIPAAVTILCRFTCGGANCSAATQGSVSIYVEGYTYPF